MHGTLIKLDEKELDQLVISEFDKVEKAAGRKVSCGNDRDSGTAREEQQRNPDNFRSARLQLPDDEERFVDDVVAWLGAKENGDEVLKWIVERFAEPNALVQERGEVSTMVHDRKEDDLPTPTREHVNEEPE